MEDSNWFNDLMSRFEVPTVLVGDFTFNLLVAFILLCVVALMYFAVRAPRLGLKLAAAGVAAVMALLLFVSHTEQLSHAKKLSLVWVKNQGERGLRVHHAEMRPPHRIYVLIEVGNAPRNFWIHWTKEMEQSLSQAMSEREQKQGRGTLRLRLESSLEREQFRFYLEPWPAPPPKDDDIVPNVPQRIERPKAKR